MLSPSSPATTTYATPNDRDVVITRVLNARRAVVFDVWTNPRHVPNWLTGPDGWSMPICEIDLRPGGRWRFVYRKESGEEMTLGGVYREVVAPERVVFTDSWGPEWPETVNTLVLTESGGQTTATYTITYASAEVRDAALKTGMKDGMEQSFARLDTIVESLN